MFSCEFCEISKKDLFYRKILGDRICIHENKTSAVTPEVATRGVL